MKHTKESLEITERISNQMDGNTFHHHYHILYDIINLYPEGYELNYVEVGCYAGGSSCLVSQRKNTNIISIDLGSPVSPEIAKKNFTKFNVHGNNYQYIQGNSHLNETLEKLKNIVTNIDVLFIDGDHTYGGVKKDFEMYSPLVRRGGYIIFDDYNDHKFSPDVKRCVDDLLPQLNEYEVIGFLPNLYDARPKELMDGNCFIIKKK